MTKIIEEIVLDKQNIQNFHLIHFQVTVNVERLTSKQLDTIQHMINVATTAIKEISNPKKAE